LRCCKGAEKGNTKDHIEGRREYKNKAVDIISHEVQVIQ
jgi:hypothetical protein